MDTQYLKRVLIRVVSTMIAIVVAAYLLYHFFSDFNSNVETVKAELYTQQDIMTTNVYIFRNENILYSDELGDVDILKENGEKVKKGTVVANVYVGSDEYEIKSKLYNIDKKIALYKNSNTMSASAVLDTSNIDNQIRQLYYVICSRIASGDLDYVVQKQDELLTLLNKRQIIVQAVKDYRDKIDYYENMRSELTSGFGKTSEKVYTNVSGYYYSDIDGYENIFSSSKIDDMTISDFEDMINSSPEQAIAENRKAVGKIVTDYKWYVACEVGNDTARKFTEGNSYDVIFPYSEDTLIGMKLYRIISEIGNDKSVMIFETGVMPDGFGYLRMQEADLVVNSYTGYKFPTEAVRMSDGNIGVYVLNGNIVKFKKINIAIDAFGYTIAEKNDPADEEYASKLSEYDYIIVKGKNLYDGKSIN